MASSELAGNRIQHVFPPDQVFGVFSGLADVERSIANS